MFCQQCTVHPINSRYPNTTSYFVLDSENSNIFSWGLERFGPVSLGSGVPRNFFRGGGLTNSVEDRGQRERGSGGGSPLVRGSGGRCNLVQFHFI